MKIRHCHRVVKERQLIPLSEVQCVCGPVQGRIPGCQIHWRKGIDSPSQAESQAAKISIFLHQMWLWSPKALAELLLSLALDSQHGTELRPATVMEEEKPFGS